MTLSTFLGQLFYFPYPTHLFPTHVARPIVFLPLSQNYCSGLALKVSHVRSNVTYELKKKTSYSIPTRDKNQIRTGSRFKY